MEKQYSDIGKILAKYPAITPDEDAVLKEWLTTDRNRKIFEELTSQDSVMQMLKRAEEIKKTHKEKWQRVLDSINQAGYAGATRKKVFWLRKWRIYVAAASVLIALSVIGYKWFNKEKQPELTTPEIAKVNDVLPGQFKAKLTLADGSTVILDTTTIGQVAQQGHVTIVNSSGKLVYQQKEQKESTAIQYNTLQTTKGQTYATVLADGSRVWLNSESSILYPVAFTGQERKVTITGEAYFEVAKAFIQKGNKSVKQPFKVVVDNMDVEVLGTHFNVNAYADEEAIKTTLLEGKVKIVSGNISSVLAAGQQAQLKRQSNLLQVMDNVDVEEAVAWKNGFFQFSDDDLKTVMRQLARWYDVEVIYQGGVDTDTYGGRINRNSKASEVLTLLGRNRVKYKIEGKKIIITP